MHEFFVCFGPSLFILGAMKWLILRGLVREQRHWGAFRGEFEDMLKHSDPSAEVHAIDFPGFGTESHRPSPTTISGIVDDLRSRWTGSSAEPWALLAISLGGMVAMNWVSRYPSDFKRLVLINSSATGLSPLHKRMKPSNYPHILGLFFERDLYSREKKILKLTTNLRGEALEARARWNTEIAKEIRQADAAAQILSALRFRPPQAIPIPLLVLGSKGDSLVDHSCSERIARRFGGRLSIHETGNHDLSIDAPVWIAAEVTAWLRENPSGI
jgi:pimeloyl-ACP methyl ester carboxylesterase